MMEAAVPEPKRTTTPVDRAVLEAFLFEEARLLVMRRFRDWMALFSDDGTYWVPATTDQKSPYDQVSLFFDDRDLMKTRIDRLEHPRIHIQTPPSRTAHLVGNVMLDNADDAAGEYAVSSTVIMMEYREDHQRVFAGRQIHKLRRTADGFRIVQKRVNLVNCDSAFEAMAVPI